MTVQLPDWQSLRLVMPELWLAMGMCAVLIAPFLGKRVPGLPAAASAASLLLALLSAAATAGGNNAAVTIFGGMLGVDPFSQFVKAVILLFALLVLLQWLLIGKRQTAAGDLPDFLCLLLGAALGMCLMASASNLLMIFIATESASFPSYALAGFRKKRRNAAEGSLKYVIFGSATSAVMVYGMSLIYGVTGTLDVPGVALFATTQGVAPMLAVGFMAMLVGFAFKLSAVPAHLWCPDVFEAAPTEVTTFLSVASKAGALAMLVRTLASFGEAAPAGHFTALAASVAVLGSVTAFWGNLVALRQTNIKRLLAYSSIAQAGYMIMGASLVPMSDTPAAASAAILFYLVVYLFMNMGAFTVVAAIAQRTGSEDIRDYAELRRRSPALALFLSLFLLSLFGMPALGGFMAKINLAVAMMSLGPAGFALIAVLFINTLISLYFYLRPLHYMYLVRDTQDRPVFAAGGGVLALLTLCAAAIVWTGLLPAGVNRLTADFATLLRGKPAAQQQALADHR